MFGNHREVTSTTPPPMGQNRQSPALAKTFVSVRESSLGHKHTPPAYGTEPAVTGTCRKLRQCSENFARSRAHTTMTTRLWYKKPAVTGTCKKLRQCSEIFVRPREHTHPPMVKNRQSPALAKKIVHIRESSWDQATHQRLYT